MASSQMPIRLTNSKTSAAPNALRSWTHSSSKSHLKASEILDELQYTYDPALNTTSILRTTAGNTIKTSYSYDPFNRLVETRQGSTTTSYSWDGAGNSIGFGAAATYNIENWLYGVTDWLAGPSPGEVAVRDIKSAVSVEFYNQHKDALERLFNRSDMPKFEML